MSRPLKSDEIEVAISSLAFGGRGVARIDGFVIFVEGAVPGDRVRAVITRSKPSYAEARTLEVLDPSGARIEPACRHFGDCGGCMWQTLGYEEQLGYKERQVSECLAHIGGVTGFSAEPPLPAEPLWRYRNKVEFSFARAADGPELGFHPPGDWRRVVAIDDCLLHSELTNRIRNRVRALVRDSGIDAWDQKSEAGFWRHLVIREGINTGEVMVNIVTAPGEFPAAGRFADALAGEFPEIASLVWSINRTRASVATGLPFTVLAGRDHIFEVICGLKLKVAPSTFMQTNTPMAERLYTRALEYADAGGDETVFDLYSGTGSIALLIARTSGQVLGIEISGEAVGLAAENAVANAVGNAVFIAGKVRVVLKDILEGRGPAGISARPDVVVLDPPRAGASKKEVMRLLELEPRRIVYVSCNPSTMAANASQLAGGGYVLDKTTAVDMFPHTPHIEVVARFSKAR